jgi:hypothetical protein
MDEEFDRLFPPDKIPNTHEFAAYVQKKRRQKGLPSEYQLWEYFEDVREALNNITTLVEEFEDKYNSAKGCDSWDLKREFRNRVEIFKIELDVAIGHNLP